MEKGLFTDLGSIGVWSYHGYISISPVFRNLHLFYIGGSPEHDLALREAVLVAPQRLKVKENKSYDAYTGAGGYSIEGEIFEAPQIGPFEILYLDETNEDRVTVDYDQLESELKRHFPSSFEKLFSEASAKLKEAEWKIQIGLGDKDAEDALIDAVCDIRNYVWGLIPKTKMSVGNIEVTIPIPPEHENPDAIIPMFFKWNSGA